LLATAWPALADEARARFEQWKADQSAPKSHPKNEIESIAASGESNLLVMPSPIRPTSLRRLPPNYRLTQAIPEAAVESAIHGAGAIPGRLYARHEGGLLSRALGTAVHALLEELARLRETLDWEAARSALQRIEPRIAAQSRAVGMNSVQAARIAAQALQLALDVTHDPNGAWILSPHANAASEAEWAGVAAGGLRAVRVDRVFMAGSAPGSEAENCWWIIDYKTAHAEEMDPARSMPQLRALFAPQIEIYAELLRNLRGAEARIFAGLYYPRALLLDWWEL
jgi:ATP-dependent exoDNAse (exonuclease V) beta subunit